MHEKFAACHDVADAKAGSGGCACHAGALAQAGQPQSCSGRRLDCGVVLLVGSSMFAFSFFLIETRSLPTLTRSYPRRFTFYVAPPSCSIRNSCLV